MKTLIVCLAILALSVPASATVWYDDGAVHNLTTQTSDSIGIDNATTVNVGGGVTITLNREALYSTTFVGYATTAGPSYLNLTGSGQILFGEEMGLAVSDGSGSSGSISMSGTSYMNPVMVRFGLRGDGIFNITDDAMLEIRGDGVTYPPQFNVGYYASGHTATINQSGNSIIQSLATGMDFGNTATAIYNLSGGQLILGDAITGPDGDDAFNFSGGTIKMAGDHLPWASERAWFNITGPNADMWFEEYDVGENVTILGFVGVFGINHSDGATIVNEEGETTDSFSLQLNDPPTDTVTVVLDPPTDDVSLNDEAPNDPITLTFTTTDWSVPQTVTVKANDDSDAEGPEKHLLTAALTSGDPYFNAAVGIIKIAVIDNDVEIKKGPYLVYPGDPTEMTVLWQLAVTQTSTLEWSEHNGAVPVYDHSVETSEYGDDHQHKYTIANLKPEFKYDYRITVDTHQYPGSFRVAPPDYAYNVKFFVYGDTRTFPADHALVTARMVETFTNDPSYQTFSIHGGDFVTNGDLESNWTDEFFNRNYLATLQWQANLPLQGCMGNHEYTGVGFAKYWPYPFLDASDGHYGSFDYGPAHFAILDQYSNGGWSESDRGFMLGAQQLAWLESDLATSDKEWKFVVFHAPGWSAGHPDVPWDDPVGQVNDRIIQKEVQPLCETYGVDVILAGDLHYYARSEVNGVHHITTGGGGAPLHNVTLDPDNPPEHLVVGPVSTFEFCTINIKGNQLEFTAIKASDASIIDSFTINHAPLADLDKNGCFDLSDLYLFAAQWLSSICLSDPACDDVDLDQDDDVDMVDFSFLANSTIECPPLSYSDSVYITEFQAVNGSTTKDEDGDLTGWIEIFNGSAEPVNLSQWYLTNDPENLTTWQFPTVEIPSEGFEVVYASGKDRATAENELHTNFLLTAQGGYLTLVKPDGATSAAEYAPYPAQIIDVSYGKLMDDATVTSQNDFFQDPTPGALNAGPPFSLIILPDTQIYSHNNPNWRNSSRAEVYIQMTSWIANNADDLNIKFVLHMGDIVHVNDNPQEWANADAAMSILDGVVPYSLVVGNHDMVLDASRDTTNFNNTFHYTRYEQEPWYGGRMADDGYAPPDNYDNAYHYFRALGMDFLVLTLEVGPTDDMLTWANNVISGHPDHRVIVTTHSYMWGNDTRDTTCTYLSPCPPSRTGEEIWNSVIRLHENIFFVMNGHHDNEDDHRGLLASIGDNENTVYQLLSGEDYDGWLRILTFVPVEDKIYVKSYSPWQPENPSQQFRQYPFTLPGYNTDEYHQYELHHDMR